MAKIAVLTTFMKFDPWYSLTGIVKDQARMLSRYGHEVHIIVNEKYDVKSITEEFPFPDVTVHPVLPFAHLADYQTLPVSETHLKTAADTAKMLVEKCQEWEIDFVYTHDILLTGWNLPYALGVQQASPQLPDVTWLHWIHSIPSGFKAWWHMAEYGTNHKIVYPNATDKIRVAENYRTTSQMVRVIPHIKDLRVMFNFSQTSIDLIDVVPALMQADVVQVYPAAADRFEAKGVDMVMQIFGHIKKMGLSVCLFIACQWATTPKHFADIDEYYKKAQKYGLIPGKEIVFSSSLKEFPFKVGISSNVLFEIMQLSNIFFFPTNHETFGLVLPEVSLASGALCVLNRSLQMMFEVGGSRTLYFDFGSNTNQHNCADLNRYLQAVALISVGRMNENDGIMTRTFMRKQYNYDNLYLKYYAPVMAEASTWK